MRFALSLLVNLSRPETGRTCTMTEYELRALFESPALIGALDEPQGEKQSPSLSGRALAVAHRFSDRVVSQRMIAGLLRAADFLVALALGSLAYLIYVAPKQGYDALYAVPLLAGPLLAVVFVQAVDGYNPQHFRSAFGQIGRVTAAWTLVFAAFAVAIFFTKQGHTFSRVWFSSWYCGSLVAFVGVRAALSHSVARWHRDGRFRRRAVIVGGGADAPELIRSLEATTDGAVQICGIFDDRTGERSPEIVQGYPRLGTIAELVQFARIAKIDLLIVSLPLTAEDRLLAILKKLWVLPVDIRLSAHTDKLRFRQRSCSYIGAVPFFDVLEKPIADWDSIIKRCFDLVFASLAIVLLAPLLVFTALAVRLESRGPIFFRQKRYGFNNELIDVLKFRSMYADRCSPDARAAVKRGDPRVTRVGRIIRKTSIDELPQLFNVLRGELSLVGPRPHALGANTQDRLYEAVIDGYFARHKVKPGVTGWAQVNGWRGDADTFQKLRSRIEHDLYYIENWSPLLDLYILLRTPFAILDTQNAF
jgi:Undecaprenyl-phosphate glucose phosphotransferase